MILTIEDVIIMKSKKQVLFTLGRMEGKIYEN